MSKPLSKIEEPSVQGSTGRSVPGFNSLKTRDKILVGFAVPLFFVVIISVVVNRSIGNLVETADGVQRVQSVIAGGQELLRLMVDMETGERGYLITGKDEFLEPFNDAQKLWNEKMFSVQNLVRDDPAQIQRLERVDDLEKQWLREAAAVEISKRRDVQVGNKSLAYMQNTLRREVGKNILDEIRDILDRMTATVLESGNQYAANLLLAISKDVVVQETGQRGFLITGDDSFLDPYTAGQRSLNRNVSDFRRVMEGAFHKGEVLPKIAEVVALSEKWLLEAANPEIQLRRDLNAKASSASGFGTIEERLSRGTGKSILDEMRASLANLNRIYARARNPIAQGLVECMPSAPMEQI